MEKEFDPEDPHSLEAQALPGGDPEVMAVSLIEEFARMGFDRERVFYLFENPVYQATYGLLQLWGAEKTRALIDKTLARCGVFQVKECHCGAGRKLSRATPKEECHG